MKLVVRIRFTATGVFYYINHTWREIDANSAREISNALSTLYAA